MDKFDYVAKDKPKIWQVRWKLSNCFVGLARKIYPANPEIAAFHLQQYSDMMILGKSITRVTPLEFYPEPTKGDK